MVSRRDTNRTRAADTNAISIVSLRGVARIPRGLPGFLDPLTLADLRLMFRVLRMPLHAAVCIMFIKPHGFILCTAEASSVKGIVCLAAWN